MILCSVSRQHWRDFCLADLALYEINFLIENNSTLYPVDKGKRLEIEV